ncbi:DNA polymerase III subunit alpha [Alcanivorax hongdengensis A-11-3]|uniref:DNA polymerase III subunit alpha n=1 Tax=Alcanivorax hongdengensis A-11-3 TaxID=1177179 RepID=L0WEG3_9GAMM|nr:DNA polymerase III subunit alpha [Alcanivorax hongdengensis]EKF75119.1 DNA polymerase III subunit alpha [Alcanivorax hongdengensis A-11-3]
MSEPRFVHLRLHTDYSLVDGVVRVKELIKSCAAQQMPAVAVTDDSNLFALIKFYKAAMGAGIKPIMGADLWVQSHHLEEPTPLSFLVQNEVGYQNLTLLISRAWQTNQDRGRALVKAEWLAELNEGLIVLSAASHGEVGQLLLAEKAREARELAAHLAAIYPDRFYLEVQRTSRPGDEDCLHATVALAGELGLPVVATNDVRFIRREDFEAHEARVCIHDGNTLEDPRRPKKYSEEQYLKSADQMVELFADLPEALQNTVEIARRCTLDIRLGENFLPDFPIPEGMTIEQYFEHVSRQGLEDRLKALLDDSDPAYAEKRKPYDDRLKFELDIINQMGFPGYFLIVADFIQWGKDNEVPVGPGRGSGAGSLVAYALKITDLDPIGYDLLFERFLNPERVSMPDFDVDFCMEKRDRVINYVADKYGRDAVSQIITFGTMAAKAVVRDVARVQGKPYGLADRLSKMIPGTPGMTLEKALEQEETLREFLSSDENSDRESANEIWEMARKLEGLTRNVGKHAGGVVIAPGKLTDFAPLYCEEDGTNLVTQYDKDDVEAAGLVKFDFLGLKTLTIIDWAVKAANVKRQREGQDELVIDHIPLDDSGSFDLLKRGDTTAVFQLESQGMKELIKKLKPDVFEDIIALVALYRPGPLESGMVDNFVNRKHGREPLAYPDPQYQHEWLEPILKPSYGVILYQEQVMQIAQVLAGYTLGGADMLRRAMGKKKPEEMAKQRAIFEEGAKGQGVDPDLAMKIFDLVEKFAGYGFNKSHSAAYALVAYQTAWLKVHYPAEFMAATISADMQNTDKVVTFIDECKTMGLQVLPPDVNSCGYRFTVNPQGDIVYGLGAIKGLGEGPIDAIVSARDDGKGDFKDLFDFCRRIDLKKINRRSLEAMVRAGVLDKLGPNGDFHDRATLLATLPDAIAAADQDARNEAAGMMDMFGAVDESPATAVAWKPARHWNDDTRLNGERDTLGLFLTGHPIDQYETEVMQFVSARLNALQPTGKGEAATVAGLVVALRITRSKRSGERMAFVTLDDKTGRVEVSVFGKTFAQYGDIVQKDTLLIFKGGVRSDDYTGGFNLVADEVMDMRQARETYARRLRVAVPAQDALADSLQKALGPYQGGNTPVLLDVAHQAADATLWLGDSWKVSPHDSLVEELRTRFGDQCVRVEY